MYKLAITVLLIISTQSAYSAENWTQSEIDNLQKFSLDSLTAPTDLSNKYLNNKSAIKLGKSLFHDKRLSSNGEISCSSCHIKNKAFTDNKQVSVGIRAGFRNTPSLLNIGQHHWFFADGAKDSLWAQALSSMENPAEQNFTRSEMVRLISNDKHYRQQYQQIFNHALPNQKQIEKLPIKAGPNAQLAHLIAWKKLNKAQREAINRIFTNIGKSIAAFVSTIKSSPTRFDAFIAEINSHQKSSRLTESEQRGLRLFISQKTGCANCHSGPLFSNKTFHNISTGIPGKDNGRAEIIESLVRDEFNCLSQYSDAKAEECLELNYVNRNKHQLAGSYKTPTLRSIGKTSPYMHDGRFKNLNQVIEHYISVSNNAPPKNDLTAIDLNEKQRADLVNFLLSL